MNGSDSAANWGNGRRGGEKRRKQGKEGVGLVSEF